MIDNLKKISAILVLVLVLGSMSTAVLATDDNDLQVSILEVEVDGIDVEDGSVIYVERGQEVPIEVQFEANEGVDDSDLKDVRVKASIGGYEYDDVEAISSIIDLESGVTYKKTLKLSIPEDIEIKDDEDTDEKDRYTLEVKIYNDDDSVEEEFILRIKEQRHRLVIQDVILRPSSTVQAGQALFATVRVENLGDKKEEDIAIMVSIPDLGVAQRTYIDELTADEENNEDEEESMSSEEIYLRIPADAKTGFYSVKVDVEYSRGHEVVSATGKIFVQGTEEETPATETKAVVGTDATTKTVKQGDEVAYKVMIANMGSTAQMFTAQVSGEKLWGSSRVDPAFVRIPAESTGEIYIYIKPNADAQAGKQMFTIKVMAGDTVVDEKTLTADVTAKESAPIAQVGNLRNALIIGFGVLIVLLIIIGLIVLFNRMSRDEESGEIPSSEGQAYY